MIKLIKTRINPYGHVCVVMRCFHPGFRYRPQHNFVYFTKRLLYQERFDHLNLNFY